MPDVALYRKIICVFLKYLVLFYKKHSFAVSDVLSALEDDPEIFCADIYITPPENGIAMSEIAQTKKIGPYCRCITRQSMRKATTCSRRGKSISSYLRGGAYGSQRHDEQPTDMVQVSFLLHTTNPILTSYKDVKD